MNTFVKNAIKCLIFALPIVALVAPNNMFFPFITGKNFLFRAAVELALCLYLALAFVDKSYRPRLNALSVAFVFFVIAMLVANIFAVDPSKAFWSNFERMDGFITLAHMFAYFVLASAVLREKKDWMVLLISTSAVSLYMTFYSFLQLAGKIKINQGGVRVDGLLGNASYLAAYLIFHIFFLLFLLLQKELKHVVLRVGCGVLITLELVVLYHTATRGAILGFIGGAFVVAALIAWKERESQIVRRGAIVFVGCVVALVVGFFSLRNTDFVERSPVLSRFANISLNDRSQARAYVWPMALDGFQERPLFGWGQEGFIYIFEKYYRVEMFTHEPWFDRAHNEFLDWLVAGGIMGFIGYISLYITALYLLWKSVMLTSREKAVLTGLIAAHAFESLFIFGNLISNMLFVTLLALISAMYKSYNQEEKQKDSVDKVEAPIIISSLILFLILVTTLNYKAYAQNITLIEAISPSKEGLQKSLELFKKALAYRSLGTHEARQQLQQLTLNVISSQNVPDQLKLAFATNTVSEYEEQIKLTPYDARPYLELGSFLFATGNNAEGITLLEEARSLAPKKQQISLTLIRAYILTGMKANDKDLLNKAVTLAKETYEALPQNDNLAVVYADALLSAGNGNEAVRIIRSMQSLAPAANQELLEKLIWLGKSIEALEFMKAAIVEDPTNSDAYVMLANIYVYQGNKQAARDTLNKLAEVVPSMKETVEVYLNQIK